MNNRKSRRELEHELLVAKLEIARLEDTINIYDRKFDKIAELNDSTPADCKRGLWCQTCQFVRPFFNSFDGPVVYACGKSEYCGNYVPREV